MRKWKQYKTRRNWGTEKIIVALDVTVEEVIVIKSRSSSSSVPLSLKKNCQLSEKERERDRLIIRYYWKSSYSDQTFDMIFYLITDSRNEEQQQSILRQSIRERERERERYLSITWLQN